MKGTVTKTIGGFFFVSCEDGKIYKTKIRGKIQQKVYPGDKVEILVADKIIEAVYPRENLLYRPKIANVDQVLLLQSINRPAFDRLLLDRFLLMVEEVQLKPLIVISKLDLAADYKSVKKELKDYQEAGYKVFFVSVKEKKGINKLLNNIRGMINVLAGPSGVGKTALINSLIPGVDLPTQEVSEKLGRGVHTTRHVELLSSEAGTWIADTPGFTSFSINHISGEELTYFWPEFKPYLQNCRFNCCSHTHEPACAVKEAVNKGEISQQRYQSYKKNYKELKNK